ncbi:MAG: hypothetical protein P1U57_03965 [Oleibacter sp.]|nr:hypothetical protein [Thalassolituus sp.]
MKKLIAVLAMAFLMPSLANATFSHISPSTPVLDKWIDHEEAEGDTDAVEVLEELKAAVLKWKAFFGIA